MGGGGWLFQALGIIFPPLQPIVRYYSAVVAVEKGDILGLLTSQVGVDLKIPPSTMNFLNQAQDVIEAIENKNWMGILDVPVGDKLFKELANIEIPDNTILFLNQANSIITAIEKNDWAGLLSTSAGQKLNIPQGTIDFIGKVQDIVEASESGDWAGILAGLDLKIDISEKTLKFINAAQDVIKASETDNWAGVLAGQAGVDLHIDEDTRKFLSKVQTVINANKNHDWTSVITGKIGVDDLNLSEETVKFLTNAQAVIKASESGDWAKLLTGKFGSDYLGIPTYMQNLISGISSFAPNRNTLPVANTYINAQFSNAVYCDGSATIPDGWTSIHKYDRKDVTGFYGEAFTNGERIVVAFRGTEFSKDWRDLVTDLQLVLRKEAQQFPDVRQFYNDLQYVISNNPQLTGQRITATGHSLGGALAQYYSVYAYEKFLQMIPAETFGAPGIINSMNDIYGEDRIVVSNVMNYDSYIINHVRESDPVGSAALGGHLGWVEKYAALPDYSVLKLAVWVLAVPMLANQHSMNNYQVLADTNAAPIDYTHDGPVPEISTWPYPGIPAPSWESLPTSMLAANTLVDNILANDIAGFIAESNDAVAYVTTSGYDQQINTSATMPVVVTVSDNGLFNQNQTSLVA